MRKHSHFQTALENPSIQTHLVLVCCIKRLCIFGPKGAIQIRYYLFINYYIIKNPKSRLSIECVITVVWLSYDMNNSSRRVGHTPWHLTLYFSNIFLIFVANGYKLGLLVCSQLISCMHTNVVSIFVGHVTASLIFSKSRTKLSLRQAGEHWYMKTFLSADSFHYYSWPFLWGTRQFTW